MNPPKHHFARHAFAVILVLLIAILSMPLTTKADTLEVSARIDAPPPLSPAIITSPLGQAQLAASPITVVGTCGDGVYVTLHKNGNLAGVTPCVSGAFSLQLALDIGSNLLQAKNYNSTDNEGPTSPSITIYFNPPSAQPDITPPVFKTTTDGAPLNQLSPYPGQFFILYKPHGYRIYKTGELWRGDISIQGGQSPYNIAVDWGDGSLFHYIQNSSDPFTLNHNYDKAGTYKPTIYALDKNGLVSSIELFITVTGPQVKDFSDDQDPYILPTLTVLGVTTLVMTALLWHLHMHRKSGQHHDEPNE